MKQKANIQAMYDNLLKEKKIIESKLETALRENDNLKKVIEKHEESEYRIKEKTSEILEIARKNDNLLKDIINK